jgi:hypothetical protein
MVHGAFHPCIIMFVRSCATKVCSARERVREVWETRRGGGELLFVLVNGAVLIVMKSVPRYVSASVSGELASSQGGDADNYHFGLAPG